MLLKLKFGLFCAVVVNELLLLLSRVLLFTRSHSEREQRMFVFHDKFNAKLPTAPLPSLSTEKLFLQQKGICLICAKVIAPKKSNLFTVDQTVSYHLPVFLDGAEYIDHATGDQQQLIMKGL